MYCLCVNVYCTAATGWLPNCSWQVYHIISYHIILRIIAVLKTKTHQIVCHPNPPSSLIFQVFLQNFFPCMWWMLFKVGGCSMCVFGQNCHSFVSQSTEFPLIWSPQQSLLNVPNYKALGHVRALLCTLLSLARPLIQTSLSFTPNPCFTVNGEVNPGLIN
jgi:hypothetical protein